MSSHCVQVSDLKLLGANKNRYECAVSDGQTSITGVTTTEVAKQLSSGLIREGSLIRLTDYACNLIGTVHKLVITGMMEMLPDRKWTLLHQSWIVERA